MRRPRHWRGRPPWWPENEVWPPANRAEMWRHGRGRFLRRIALVFSIVLFLSAFGTVTLVSRLIGGSGVSSQYVSPTAAAITAGVFLAIILIAAMRRFGVPFGNIVDAANRIADGEYSTRVREHGPPSLRMVATAFNSMAAKLQSQDQQRRHLMADIAHELRTPLSIIQGRLEGLLDGVYALDAARIAELLEETHLLSRLVEDLRTLADSESGTLTLNKEPTDMKLLMQDVVALFSSQAEAGKVSLHLDASNLPLVSVDPLRMREVLVNLLSNALHHTPANGTISIAARLVNDRLTISVADTGSGIAAEDVPKIFDRFYKGTGSHGSGLGLTIARNLVLLHKGEISAESHQGKGTIIRIALPVLAL